MPIPYPENEEVESERLRGLSRAVRSRVKRRVGWPGWANAAVHSMNEIFGKKATSEVGGWLSAMHLSSLSRICDAYRRISAVDCNSTAEAFKALCGSVPGYTRNGVKQATFKEGLVSLPDPGTKLADGFALLTGSDLEAWRDWRRVLLRSPSELREMIPLEERIAPHTDPELKRKPRRYARLVRDMSLRGLVSFGATSEATVGVFVVPKKLGKQRLIFDTRRVNQHFRRPWHCALPAPSSWAGLQLPADSAYHMVQTDVTTAFYRILAPLGMSECFILPSVSIQLLLREGVNVPEHLRHLPDVSPQLRVLAMVFFLGSLLLSEDGGELRAGS